MVKNTLELISQKHIGQRIGLLALLGIAVHLILPQITALENSWRVLKSMALWGVGLAFIAQVLSYLGSGFLLQKTLAIARQVVSLMRSTLIVLGAASVGMVAGGTVGSSAAIYRWTSADEGSVEGATLASILPSLFNNLMLVLLSIFGLVHLILVHNLTQAQLIGFSLLAVRCRSRASAAIIWGASHVARLRRRPYDPSLIRKEIDYIFTAWDALWRGEWHVLALRAFLNSAFDMLTLYLLFIAAGANVSLGV